MRPFLVLLALLLVPSVQATEGIDVSEHRIDLGQQGNGVAVQEEICFTVTDAGTFGGNLSLNAPRGTQFLAGAVVRGDQRQPLAAEDVEIMEPSNPSLEAGVLVRVGTTAESEALCVELDTTVPQTLAYSKTLVDATDQLLVFARPLEDHSAFAINLGDLQPTGDGRVHATLTDVRQGFTVAIVFQPADVQSPLQDLTKYVWGAAGLVVGVFLMYVFVKQGWIRIHRPKRFEKGGGMESSTMLQARRRTLMAALKELELAHDAKEIPDEAYAPLKEEYKAQAVRVLRSLDQKQEPSKE